MLNKSDRNRVQIRNFLQNTIGRKTGVTIWEMGIEPVA
jgi:hypothetical protein